MEKTVKYDHQSIEEKWQELWQESGAFRVDVDAPGEKFYLLEMFPYPSGKIHMGHVRNYSIGDVLARFFKMRGKNVLHPMGWDSFGLPAENAAIQHNIHPAEWTVKNIDYMRTQLKRIGFSYDWEREVATCKVDYYRWNQWFFLKFFEKGLAYKKSATVNWCEPCNTVLANEQVEDGLCWRCESTVEQKELDQWFYKITDYAEELLEGTEKLTGWPERVLAMQRNWIGKSTGALVTFPVVDSTEVIDVFTTRPDTLYGTTFMSLAPTHPLVAKITAPGKLSDVREFVKKVGIVAAADLNDDFEKEGVFTGTYCRNPLTGVEIPVYVANFVLMGYGTGAVMAVPAHDQRDFEFAKKYDLPINVVITPEDAILDADNMDSAYVEQGVMINSAKFDGQKNTDAGAAITEFLEEGGIGKSSVTYRLRDWGISRQRYWGCPIPVVYCPDCGVVPVKESDLPVRLPEDIEFTSGGRSPLLSVKEFCETTCPRCDGEARRETDTMDTFVDSSWYFLRYLSPKDDTVPFNEHDASYWMPVDQYIGGIEHAVMHLLYARFFTKAVRDLGLFSDSGTGLSLDDGEPFKNLLTQGMVCKETQKCPEHGYLLPEESDGVKCNQCGMDVVVGAVEKMSKSKKNTVDPDGIVKTYGADTTRLFSLFAAPPERDLDWSEDGVEGSSRFIRRVWRLVVDNIDSLGDCEPFDGNCELTGELRKIHRTTHKTIKKVTEDIERRFHFNTAISSIMELVNVLYKWIDVSGGLSAGDAKKPDAKSGSAPDLTVASKKTISHAVFREAVNAVVVLLSPFAPHVTEELWQRLGNTEPLFRTPWPEFNSESISEDEVTIVVQVNGKVRSRVNVPANAGKNIVEEIVLKDPKVTPWTLDKEVKKIIYIPNKIFNIVAI